MSSGGDPITFVIEHCADCHLHAFNTRHDALKYLSFGLKQAEKIKELLPECQVLTQKVPKIWAESDIYCQMIPNDNELEPCYQIVPRVGAFEVSVNGILIFSKILSRKWPNISMVA